MLRIPCPFCGLRDHNEFTYGADGTIRRPDPETASARDWIDHVYPRTNAKGPHQEYWHHTHGCRSWLVVTRDTLTHEILDVRYTNTEEAGS